MPWQGAEPSRLEFSFRFDARLRIFQVTALRRPFQEPGSPVMAGMKSSLTAVVVPKRNGYHKARVQKTMRAMSEPNVTTMSIPYTAPATNQAAHRTTRIVSVQGLSSFACESSMV